MMDIKINLLSPNKQKHLERMVKFIFSKYILEIVIFFAAIIASFMIWSWIILQEGFAQLAATSATVNKEYLSQNKDIRDINFKIKNIQKSSQSYNPLTPYLRDVMNNLPANIKLVSFYINITNKEVILQGVAKTRQDLLNYQTELLKIGWLSAVSTPVSKLFQKENISFEFKTGIKNKR